MSPYANIFGPSSTLYYVTCFLLRFGNTDRQKFACFTSADGLLFALGMAYLVTTLYYAGYLIWIKLRDHKQVTVCIDELT